MSGTVNGETRRIVAGPEYQRSWLHNLWFGKNYRDLWTQPIEVEMAGTPIKLKLEVTKNDDEDDLRLYFGTGFGF